MNHLPKDINFADRNAFVRLCVYWNLNHPEPIITYLLISAVVIASSGLLGESILLPTVAFLISSCLFIRFPDSDDNRNFFLADQNERDAYEHIIELKRAEVIDAETAQRLWSQFRKEPHRHNYIASKLEDLVATIPVVEDETEEQDLIAEIEDLTKLRQSVFREIKS